MKIKSNDGWFKPISDLNYGVGNEISNSVRSDENVVFIIRESDEGFVERSICSSS